MCTIIMILGSMGWGLVLGATAVGAPAPPPPPRLEDACARASLVPLPMGTCTPRGPRASRAHDGATSTGTIVSNLSNLDPEGDEFTNTMSELNKMMTREGLPYEMRVRLRQYFHQTHHIRQGRKRNELLELMSPTLKAEVAWEVNKEWLGRVWFLHGASLAFLVQVHMPYT